MCVTFKVHITYTYTYEGAKRLVGVKGKPKGSF